MAAELGLSTLNRFRGATIDSCPQPLAGPPYNVAAGGLMTPIKLLPSAPTSWGPWGSARLWGDREDTCRP